MTQQQDNIVHTKEVVSGSTHDDCKKKDSLRNLIETARDYPFIIIHQDDMNEKKIELSKKTNSDPNLIIIHKE